ncbi:MAG TPA: hypothetical protein VN789_03185 [Casimicrobiaceae bacterium]|jgi:hypothetical protein|nr:hypothetical protein [Casimicrobiaceae bacterium]
MTRRLEAIVVPLAAALSALMLAGCGERPQVVDYKQGTYSGKPDTPAWSNAPFNGNEQEWTNVLKQRAQNQNEYKRIGG